MAHIYIWLPTYGLSQSKRCKHFPECRYSQDGKSTDPFCHVSLTLASSPSLLFPFFFSLSLSPLLSLYFISFSVISHEPGIAGNSVLGDCLRRLSSFFGGLEPDIAGNSVSGKSFPRFFSSFLLVVGYEPDITGNSVSGEDFRQLSLVSLGGFESGIAGNSVSDKNLPYSITLLSLSLPRSGKGPCIMHTSKKMQWKVGSRYITPIQPYRFCRQLYPCYQIRLCSIIQLNCEDVLVVIWFPCWGPVWSMGWDANATLLFFYSAAPRTSCLGSPVARYHRPFESRPVDSSRRETYQQLAACSSPPYSGWFAPVSIPPGSSAALGPVTEPPGGKRPGVKQKPRRGRR